MPTAPTYLMSDTPNIPPVAAIMFAIPNLPWLLPLIWDKVPLPTFIEVALPLGMTKRELVAYQQPFSTRVLF